MKGYQKYFIGAAVLVVFIIVAWFGYDYLSSRYQAEEPTKQSAKENEKDRKKAADFTVTDSDGNEVKLSDYFGKPVVINFWATWCGPCKSELPSFESMYLEKKDEIVFMMVNLTDGYRDTVKKVKEFISDGGYSFPVYFDLAYSAANAYQVNSIPMTVFIDKNGSVIDSHIGMINEKALADGVKMLLK